MSLHGMLSCQLFAWVEAQPPDPFANTFLEARTAQIVICAEGFVCVRQYAMFALQCLA